MTSPPARIRIGTRGSKLAMIQAHIVASELHRLNTDIETEIIQIKTEGDKDQRSSLKSIGGQGVFVKTIEEALLDNLIDLAVHSAKDLPSKLDNDFIIPAVLPRGNVEDALISRGNHNLENLPQNSLIGCGSPRRISQLRRYRSDLRFEEIRGNIDTRLRKLDDGLYDAIILANAGLQRLGLSDKISQVIPTQISLPAPGQGIIAIELLISRNDIIETTEGINHRETFITLTAERAFLRELSMGCGLPIAGMANIENNEMKIVGRLLSEDGPKMAEKTISGKPEDADSLGENLAKILLDAFNEVS